MVSLQDLRNFGTFQTSLVSIKFEFWLLQVEFPPWPPQTDIYEMVACTLINITVCLVLISSFSPLGVICNETTIVFPATNEEILSKIQNTLESGTKLAVFGHIPSNYPVVMPVKDITRLCHMKGVPVLIDGAHALGSLPLNLNTLKADYYVANAHKWLACPKVCFFCEFMLCIILVTSIKFLLLTSLLIVLQRS